MDYTTQASPFLSFFLNQTKLHASKYSLQISASTCWHYDMNLAPFFLLMPFSHFEFLTQQSEILHTWHSSTSPTPTAWYIPLTTSRYLDFPSLVAFSSSHPSLSWLWPDFYDFTVSRNMLKVKDAADVVLMNNFLADFPVEEVGPYYKTCRAMIVKFINGENVWNR